MHFENALTTAHIRSIKHDHPVKPAGSEKRRVEYVRAIGSRHENDTFVDLETVHLHEQLIQCLFALIMTAAQASTTQSADRIDLVYENDTG